MDKKPTVNNNLTKRDQAKIIWLEAKRMIKKSPALSKRIKTLVAEINSSMNDSFFKPLGGLYSTDVVSPSTRYGNQGVLAP